MSLRWVQTGLQEKLGFSPYPATFNVRLESDKEVARWQEIQREKSGMELSPVDSSFCHARIFPVEIWGRLRGAVLFPEVEDYPANKLEVIAPVRIKEEFQVRDGDRITLEFLT